jgi:hypothetical protein
MVKTKSPKKIDFSSGGITKAPSCPSATATSRVQAVAPTVNPRICMRPRIVPMATARKMKISGAAAAT